MADISGFDATTVEPNGFAPLPAGDYEVIITNSEWKFTKDKSGRYIELKLQVISGPYQNRILFDIINLNNKNPKAVAIAQGTMSSICRAVGIMKPIDTNELHNKALIATVKVQKSEQYEDKNVIRGYRPRRGSAAPQPAGQPQTTASQATPPSLETAPWKA